MSIKSCIRNNFMCRLVTHLRSKGLHVEAWSNGAIHLWIWATCGTDLYWFHLKMRILWLSHVFHCTPCLMCLSRTQFDHVISVSMPLYRGWRYHELVIHILWIGHYSSILYHQSAIFTPYFFFNIFVGSPAWWIFNDYVVLELRGALIIIAIDPPKQRTVAGR